MISMNNIFEFYIFFQLSTSLLLLKSPLYFPLARPMCLQLLHFQLKCFSELCSKGHPVVSYPDICPAQIRKSGSRLFPPSTSAAFSMAALTYTVKRLSQHWRSRLCVKRQTVRGGDWKINGFMFSSCLPFSLGSLNALFYLKLYILFRVFKKRSQGCFCFAS